MWDPYFAGLPERTTVVAEIGNVHEGSLGECYALMRAVAAAGVDAVKFQCHIALAESSAEERFPPRFEFHPQDKTRQDYWRRMEFTASQWHGLAAEAGRLGLEFIVTPFSVQAVERVGQLAERFKIGSAQLDDLALLAAVKKTGRPVILSTGMATTLDVDRAVTFLALPPEKLTVLQCTTEYPCPPEKLGLNYVFQYSRNMLFAGGLSDHSGHVWASLAAVALGAALLEVHVCWDRRQFACDAASSIEVRELAELVRGVRWLSVARSHPVDKDALARELAQSVACYRQGKQRETYTYD